ncbi:hypothetical protein Acr_02g0003400 [Actinidia rufa]|uniref:Uncharacterized protein n=1 Tax=Actinidia rufa TaxID=165716 RepID=A0A7J0E6R7_9ERIC|nr:hypothetical protein Acr_02g0003400 [Actinidia rufa]
MKGLKLRLGIGGLEKLQGRHWSKEEIEELESPAEAEKGRRYGRGAREDAGGGDVGGLDEAAQLC